MTWAQAVKSIPVFGTTHADHSHLPIPCTPWLGRDQVEGQYEEETGKLIVKCFKEIVYLKQPMVLVGDTAPSPGARTPPPPSTTPWS